MKKPLVGAVGIILVLAAAVGIAIPRAANAALLCSAGSNNTVGSWTCTETVTFGPAPADFLNQPLALDKWVSHASTGFIQTLTDVKYSEGGTRPLSVTVTNDSATGQTIDFNLTGALSFAAGAGSPSNFLPSLVTFSSTFSPAAFFLPSGGTSPLFNVEFDFGPTSPVVNTTGLASYVGPGTFNALLSTATNFTFTQGEGSLSAAITKSASANMILTYDFTTTLAVPPTRVPEPASLLLLGSGLAGFLMIRRCRRG